MVERIGAPEPAITRDLWARTGEVVQIEIPAGMTRGKVRCPCGGHNNGDRNPSGLFDDALGRVTCMVSGAVYARLVDGSGWVLARPPRGERLERRLDDVRPAEPTSPGHADEAREGDPRVYIRPIHETHGDTCAPRQVPDALRPDRRDAPWIMGRAPWGRLITSTLRRDPDPHDADRVVTRRSDSPSGRIVRGPDGKPQHEWRSLAAIMRHADGRYGGPVAEETAYVRAACERHAPDRLVSTERYVLDAEASTWAERADGSRYIARPVYRSVGTDLVVLDIDGLAPGDTAPDPEAAERILAACRAAGWRVVSIVATSREGLQIVLRLPGWCPRPELIYRDLGVRRALMDAGQRVIAALGRGGHVDTAAWAANRRIRRPGWRTKNGQAVRARLWWDCERGHNDRP